MAGTATSTDWTLKWIEWLHSMQHYAYIDCVLRIVQLELTALGSHVIHLYN